MFKSGLDTFGKDFGHFCNFKKFLIFLRIFEDSTHQGTLGKKIFEIITPKHVQNTFGHLWERFWVCLEFWKIFDFFENFRQLDPPWNTGQKNFFKKITPKHVQNTFGQLWERFWVCLEFWKIFDFFENFRQLDPPWNTGQKNFFKKINPKHVQNTFEHFWYDCGQFWNFKSFLIFLKIFEDSTLHRTLGKKTIEKITPKYVQNTFGHFWERF